MRHDEQRALRSSYYPWSKIPWHKIQKWQPRTETSVAVHVYQNLNTICNNLYLGDPFDYLLWLLFFYNFTTHIFAEFYKN